MQKYKIIVSSKAQSDISEHIAFLKKASEKAAKELAKNIFSSLESLSIYPERNPIFEMPKTFNFTIRKFLISNRYIALYSAEKEIVVIHRILDARRKFNNLIF